MTRFPYDDAVLQSAMKVAGVRSKAALARRFGITPQALNSYRADGRLPVEHLVALALETGTSVESLLKGKSHTRKIGSAAVRAVREVEAEYGDTPSWIISAVREIFDSGDRTVIEALEHNLKAFLQAIRAQPERPKQARQGRAQRR